jgi:1,4-dihydroxy-6-naphthoate synthase
MFYHLLKDNLFDTDLTIADVEALNQKALRHELDISKVSFYAAWQVMDHYTLLDAGAAVGKKCGPLLVTQDKQDTPALKDATIATPGRSTTAHLLFSLYGNNQGKKECMPFNEIMPAVQNGLVDYGVIIHEGRFTCEQYGLREVADLGTWWEKRYALPLPLGGIIARQELSSAFIRKFNQALHESIVKALAEKDDCTAPLYAYIKEHAQELDDSVIQQHIDLYVNKYSLSLNGEGRLAVEKLFALVKEYNL